MTTSRFSLLLLVTVIVSCGSPEKPQTPPPSLTAEQQATRAQGCMGEIDVWRAKGVWIHGGVEPAVNRDAWSSLKEGEKQQIADIAACIASAGTFEPREVQIVSEGFRVPIEKIHSDNLLFVEEFRKAGTK